MPIRLEHIRDALDRFDRDHPPDRLDPETRGKLLLVAVRVAMAVPLPVVH